MQYSSNKVTALISNSSWDFVTDIRNWDLKELRELLAEDTEDDKWRVLSPHKMDFPYPITNSIADVPQARPANTSRAAFASLFPSDALGNLGRLPLEIVWEIIGNMDIESFLKFAATSRLARSLCKHHPAFRNIARYLPPMLIVLRGLGLHQWVPVGALWGEMQQPKCRSCGEKGNLLFIPTVDRICVNCLMYNPAYWAIRFSDAKRAFALEHRNCERVPAFRDRVLRITGNRPPLNPPRPVWLFPIKPTLKVAIQFHGSRENVRAIAEQRALDRFSDSTTEEQKRGFLHRFLRDATPLGKLPCDPTQVPKIEYDLVQAQIYADIDIRRAVTWIPYLLPQNRTPVKLYRCKGCRFTLDHFKITPEHRRYMGDADLDVTPCDYSRILTGRTMTFRTWDDMQEHIPKCLGSGLRMWQRFILSRHPDELGSDF